MRTNIYFIGVFILAILAGAFGVMRMSSPQAVQKVRTIKIEKKHQHHIQHKRKKRKRKRRCNPHHINQSTFDQIKINTHANVILRKVNHSSEVNVEIEGSGISKHIQNGVLHLVDTRRSYGCKSRKATVYISFDNLASIHHNGSGNVWIKSAFKANEFVLTSNGSGNVYMKDIRADQLKAFIKGSADLLVSGQVDALDVKSFGSGNLRAFGLSSDVVKAETKGSGDIMVTANDFIQASIYGSGDVKYKGSAFKTIINKRYHNQQRHNSGELIKVK